MKMIDLSVVIPVYNEEAAIGQVLDKWRAMLDDIKINYRIRVYNDGSKDGTLDILHDIAAKSDGKVVVIDKPNSGHGPTILLGYLEAAKEAEWIFQIDSDDEMGPESFPELWSRRYDYDFLVGKRAGRQQPVPRKIISAVSRTSIRLFYGKGGIWDVNTPYRLMRTSEFRNIFRSIPNNTFAPNVILSGVAARNHFHCFEFPVPQHNRTTGEVSIKKWKLLKAAIKSFIQTVSYSFIRRH